MSKERTGLTVVVTMLVTSGLLVALGMAPKVFRATNRDRTSGRGAGATT
jgi:hypothetical protein